MSVTADPVAHPEPSGISPLRYRRVSEPDFEAGECLTLSGGEIEWRGRRALPLNTAAEVCLDAVNDVSPPLTLFVELAHCEPLTDTAFTLTGAIRLIRSDTIC